MNEHRKKDIFVSSGEQENLFSHWQLKRRITTTTKWHDTNDLTKFQAFESHITLIQPKMKSKTH